MVAAAWSRWWRSSGRRAWARPRSPSPSPSCIGGEIVVGRLDAGLSRSADRHQSAQRRAARSRAAPSGRRASTPARSSRWPATPPSRTPPSTTLLARDCRAVLVGGSGLYLRAGLGDLGFAAPPSPAAARGWKPLANTDPAALRAQLRGARPGDLRGHRRPQSAARRARPRSARRRAGRASAGSRPALVRRGPAPRYAPVLSGRRP